MLDYFEMFLYGSVISKDDLGYKTTYQGNVYRVPVFEVSKMRSYKGCMKLSDDRIVCRKSYREPFGKQAPSNNGGKVFKK